MMGTICTFGSLIKGPRLLRGALTKDGCLFLFDSLDILMRYKDKRYFN